MTQQPPGGAHGQGRGHEPPEQGGHEPGDYSRFPVDDTPGFNEWEPVSPGPFGQGGFEQPFQLHAIALKSSSRQSEVFIHDPVRALTGRSQGVDFREEDGFVGEPLLQDDPPRITSLVVRHERTLEHRVVRSLALVDDDGSVTLITHKQER